MAAIQNDVEDVVAAPAEAGLAMTPERRATGSAHATPGRSLSQGWDMIVFGSRAIPVRPDRSTKGDGHAVTTA